MPGPNPSNKPFPSVPKSMDWFSLQRFFVSWSEWASQFVVDLDPPGPLPSATGTANNLTVILSWEPAKKAAIYRINRGLSGDFADSTVIAEVAASKTKVARYTWQDSEDQRQAKRYYWITPLNERGVEGPKSELIEVTNFSTSTTGTAAGINARATGTDSLALGNDALASGNSAIAIGDDSRASATNAIAVGNEAIASASAAVAIGNGTTASGANALAMGTSAVAQQARSVAIGIGSLTSGISEGDSVVIGNSAATDKSYSIGIGTGAVPDADHQLALGNGGAGYIDDARVYMTNTEAAFHLVRQLTELTTIAAAATTDTVIQIPADVVVKAVAVRVVTAIPTAATFTVTGATSGTVFSTAAVSTAATTTNKGNAAAAYYNATAQSIRFTPNAVPGAATGQVRVVLFYEDVRPPTLSA